LKLLRERVNTLDEHCRLQALGDNAPDNEDLPASVNGNWKLGSPQQPSTISDIETRSQTDHAFQGFRKKFTEFINQSLPTYGHQLPGWLTFPADFQVRQC
jgi:hypothetical protein